MPAVVGDVLELHCNASRGSPPILYEFYHEDVLLGNHSAPMGGGASFNLSLSAEHSGNYSCKANNYIATEHSDTMSFTVTGEGILATISLRDALSPLPSPTGSIGALFPLQFDI